MQINRCISFFTATVIKYRFPLLLTHLFLQTTAQHVWNLPGNKIKRLCVRLWKRTFTFSIQHLFPSVHLRNAKILGKFIQPELKDLRKQFCVCSRVEISENNPKINLHELYLLYNMKIAFRNCSVIWEYVPKCRKDYVAGNSLTFWRDLGTVKSIGEGLF